MNIKNSKRLVVTVTSILFIIMAGVLGWLFVKSSQVPVLQTNPTQSAKPTMQNQPVIQPTDESTVCQTDSQCWCRNFDGAHFTPGKAPNRCNLQAGHCNPCYYE